MNDDLETRIEEAVKNPHNLGEMENADAIGTVGSPDCGDMLRMWIKFKEENGRKVIDRATFQSFGCQTAIAVASVATEMLAGKTIAEAQSMSGEDLAAPLGALAAGENSLRAAGGRRAARGVIGRRANTKVRRNCASADRAIFGAEKRQGQNRFRPLSHRRVSSRSSRANARDLTNYSTVSSYVRSLAFARDDNASFSRYCFKPPNFLCTKIPNSRRHAIAKRFKSRAEIK